MFFITKNCSCISDSGKDEYRNKGRSHEGMFKFRLLDDDGEIYFYGYSSTCDDEAAFEPLDYYGEAYGCTMMEYKNSETGEYEQLYICTNKYKNLVQSAYLTCDKGSGNI